MARIESRAPRLRRQQQTSSSAARVRLLRSAPFATFGRVCLSFRHAATRRVANIRSGGTALRRSADIRT
eukprot:1176235-Prorocentrum_minimum.AAC.2